MSILRDPRIILLSIALGILMGVEFKDIAIAILPFGEMYISLLQMCVIPILITAIISSFGKLVSDNAAKKYLKKLVMFFVVFTLSIGAVGSFTGYLGLDYLLDEKSKKVLGEVVQSGNSFDLSISITQPVVADDPKGLMEFIKNLIPNNIFQSLQDGVTLQILFFSVILGLALGYTNTEESTTFIRYTHVLFHSFQKIIGWAMYALPFGLVCLLAGKVASIGTDILIAMVNFVILFYLAGIIISIINFVILWKVSQVPLKDALRGVREPTIFALATVNSFACLPPVIEGLLRDFRYRESTVNLVTPIGITLGRYGNVMFFALATLFVSRIYDIDLSVTDLPLIIIGASLAGLSTAGATGIVTLTMLSIVLKPLGLPSETAIIIFLAVDPIIDPMRTLLIVNTNMTISSLISEKERRGVSSRKW